MLYCEMFIVSHALGNGASSSVIGIVLTCSPLINTP